MSLNYKVEIRFSEESRPIIKKHAEKLGLNVSGFIRSAVLTIIQNMNQEGMEVSLLPAYERGFIINFVKGGNEK